MSSDLVVMPKDKVLTIGIPTDVHENLLKAQCKLNINRIHQNNRKKKISLDSTIIECLRAYFKESESNG